MTAVPQENGTLPWLFVSSAFAPLSCFSSSLTDLNGGQGSLAPSAGLILQASQQYLQEWPHYCYWPLILTVESLCLLCAHLYIYICTVNIQCTLTTHRFNLIMSENIKFMNSIWDERRENQQTFSSYCFSLLGPSFAQKQDWMDLNNIDILDRRGTNKDKWGWFLCL